MSAIASEPCGMPATDPAPTNTMTDSVWGNNNGIQAANGGGEGSEGFSAPAGDNDSNAGDFACFNCGKTG